MVQVNQLMESMKNVHNIAKLAPDGVVSDMTCTPASALSCHEFTGMSCFKVCSQTCS